MGRFSGGAEIWELDETLDIRSFNNHANNHAKLDPDPACFGTEVLVLIDLFKKQTSPWGDG